MAWVHPTEKIYTAKDIPEKLKYCFHIVFTVSLKCIMLFYMVNILEQKKCILNLIRYFGSAVNFNLNCNCVNCKLFSTKCIYIFVTLCCRNLAMDINRIINGKISRISLNNGQIYNNIRKYLYELIFLFFSDLSVIQLELYLYSLGIWYLKGEFLNPAYYCYY